jgi:hypothetical protein
MPDMAAWMWILTAWPYGDDQAGQRKVLPQLLVVKSKRTCVLEKSPFGPTLPTMIMPLLTWYICM